MAKNSFQDIITSKSVKNPVHTVRAPLQRTPEEPYSPPPSKPKHTLWFIAILAVVFLVFSVASLFSNATVTVFPKQKTMEMHSSFGATKDGSNDALNYDLIVLSGEETETVATTGIQDSLVKATGTAIIYNAFSGTAFDRYSP